MIQETPTVIEFNRIFEGLATAQDYGDGTFSVTIGGRMMLLGIRAELVPLGSQVVASNNGKESHEPPVN